MFRRTIVRFAKYLLNKFEPLAADNTNAAKFADDFPGNAMQRMILTRGVVISAGVPTIDSTMVRIPTRMMLETICLTEAGIDVIDKIFASVPRKYIQFNIKDDEITIDLSDKKQEDIDFLIKEFNLQETKID